MRSGSRKRQEQRLRQLLQFDRKLQRQRKIPSSLTAGIDEVGRGPLAGPLVACALILHKSRFTVSIDDSKVLSPAAREVAYRQILPSADIGIGFVTPQEIDSIGIHSACGLAMVRAIRRLPDLPAMAFIDGPWIPRGCPVPAVPIVDGDSKSLAIACASIVAKVIRDRLMVRVHGIIPEYGFRRHKGYGTREHLTALRAIGPSSFHRFSFQPIRGVESFV